MMASDHTAEPVKSSEESLDDSPESTNELGPTTSAQDVEIKEDTVGGADQHIEQSSEGSKDRSGASISPVEDNQTSRNECNPKQSTKETDLDRLQSICYKLGQDPLSIQLSARGRSTDSILQILVTEDMSNIRSQEVLNSLFVNYLHRLPTKVVSEVLSVLIAIVKKSVFHLESARGLIIPCIKQLISDSTSTQITRPDDDEHSTASSTSLTRHFLREWINLLIAHSCDVEELKSILKSSEHDHSLLGFIQQANLKQRNRPAAFFAFPGTKGSMMSLPPFQKWPIQVGWSFSTWFFLEPKACAQPYLFNFKTGKSGLGYSAHFTGNCLVLTSIRVKGKGVQHCVAYEFPSYKWIHCAITYHNKWRASEIKVYVNGQLSANIEMPWQVQTTEIFDKCYIGGSGSINSTDRLGDLNCFCGQMSALYLFNEGLSPAQICAIHRLGPSYTGQFKYSNESHVNLPPQISKALYEEKLASTLFCLFAPVAVDSGTLCIQLAPFRSSTSISAQNYFVSAPHAALLGQTKSIITQPICSTLQSLGCSRSLLPLLDVFATKKDPEACASLIGFLCDLLESSPHWFANEIVQSNGFVIVSCALTNDARSLLSERLLDIFLNLAKTLLTTSSTAGDSMLLKHLMDNILFNPTLWVYAQTKLQIKLYSYLANEFLYGTRQNSNKYTVSNSGPSSPFIAHNPTSSASATMSNLNYAASPSSTEDQIKSALHETSPSAVADVLFGEIRRVSTVLQSLHALKYYYWIGEENGISHKARDYKLRPKHDELKAIRSHILMFTRELINRASGTPLDEIQGLLNYLSSCTHSENLLDVIDTLATLLKNHPTPMVSALDQKQGVRVIFTLIGSKNEEVRIKSLELLCLFLANCSHKKKQEIMGSDNLFMLICDRLKSYRPLSLEIYNSLMNILLEIDNFGDPIAPRDLSKLKIENSVMIKVVATLLHEEKDSKSQAGSRAYDQDATKKPDIRRKFINDLWNLIVFSKENRRTILQMSVWQHWLVNLIDSTIEDSQLIRDQVLAIFRVLLYHAVRYEYGGWRVWIDTLAIIHTKVSYDEFCQQLNSDTVVSSKYNASETKQIPTDYEEFAMSETQREIQQESASDTDDKSSTNPKVISISERVPRESSGIQIEDTVDVDEIDSKPTPTEDEMTEVRLSESDDMNALSDSPKPEISLDSTDVAPSRAFRRMSVGDDKSQDVAENLPPKDQLADDEINCHQSLTSISLNEPPNNHANIIDPPKEAEILAQERGEPAKHDLETSIGSQDTQSQKATASPAFRIPEFKWGTVLVKLLNDLMFSIECDLYHWRCAAKCTNLDTPPFTPNSHSTTGQSSSNSSSTRQAQNNSQIESILQKPEIQIYIMNIVHFVSQLADNIIIASGGLLPLLADATGGTRSSTSADNAAKPSTCEGLTIAQANSLLYRLINMVDMVIFTATHINLNELEADKNTTSGGILRQCLRLACTVTVKNCLVVRGFNQRIEAMGIGGGYSVCAGDFPRDMFDSYQGCSLLSANGLFECPLSSLENSDLIANLEYSPHQTPNTTSMPSLLPFQPIPIKDPNKLLQPIDISRIQACIYHDMSPDSRQSQFLALSSLYFISVLMVSKYRDIIEPRSRSHQKTKSSPNASKDESAELPASGFKNGGPVSNIESNLLNFGRMQPTATGQPPKSTNSALTDMLTTKLENTLNTVCPLLKSIMCDFCSFLSKTLIGSHGQDLVSKEADRTFKRSNTSPVELVMLLCSQEWQNTLQKNAGLAFIELINEGRVLSHGMKDHIVRVAMEAEFILSRLRADDVAKHEHFGIACSESQSARLHEEALINSLISSATRRDYVLYCKFRESEKNLKNRNYKLDIWEDDDRRKRRFVIDSWDDEHQNLYLSAETENHTNDTSEQKTVTNRILELQQTIEMGGIDDHCSHVGANPDSDESHAIATDKDEDCEDDFDEEDEDQPQNDSNSPDSDNEPNHRISIDNQKCENFVEDSQNPEKQVKSYNVSNSSGIKPRQDIEGRNISGTDAKNIGVWDYEDCNSVTDFSGSVVFASECSLIWSIYAIPGVLQLTSHELHFEPNQNLSDSIDALGKEPSKQDEDESQARTEEVNQNDYTSSSDSIRLRKIDLKVLRYCDFLTCNGKVLLSDIRAIFSRHYLLQPNALEIFLAQRTSVMFAFSDFDTVKRVIKYLPPVGVGIKYGIPQSRRASLMAPRQLFAASNMMQKWQRREIGNFQYLMFLNTIAGRTYQDLNQYPVFPWILTNYDSEELDLNLPSNFRDLSKPVGALNTKRRSMFIERYQSWDNPKVPAFHYGTHYSTAAFTLNWLCRLRGSYNSAYLALQDGKYEEESRLFLSIGDSWVSSLTGGQQNVKELVPEFFYLPEMFHSSLGLSEVEYPPWANSAEQFVRIHRLALESELVSCQLHQWIDLIFGYKQRGPEAVSAVNTFYHLTYQGNVNLNMIQDLSLREAVETQIKHFGQTPSQLTTEPHPPRFSALHASPLVFSSSRDDVNKIVKFPFNTPIVHISSCISNYITSTSSTSDGALTGTAPDASSAISPSSVMTITSNNQYQIHKWMPNEQSEHSLIIDPQLEQSNLARRQLIDVDDLCSGISLKVHQHDATRDVSDEIQWACSHYVVTLDGRYIIMGSFYDNSFRVFTTESGKLCQVIYGHRGPITCIARSDGNAAADFYVATGSQDCSLLLWTWNEKYAQIEGSGVSAVHNPLPKLSVCGHQSAVLSIVICAELGLVISGSKNLILVHTTTSGENLLEIDIKLPEMLYELTRGTRKYSSNQSVHRPLVENKQKTILEASMLGDDDHGSRAPSDENSKQDKLSKDVTSRTDLKGTFPNLKDLCQSDYYVTNLQVARELAFIVCIALPPPWRKGRLTNGVPIKAAPAMLMTFNLKGSLMGGTTFGSTVTGPSLGDTCVMQITRDGEHIILNDSQTTLKVYKTFNLQPIHSYNTNELPNSLSEEHNRVRSMTLLNHRYIFVGLENGKIVIYNVDLKNLQ